MLLLGIETSCDDTATAVVRDGRDVLANVSTNQDEFHAKYGGIVPEIASRRHASLLSAAIDDALVRAGTSLGAIDGIAVTAGPGLIGSLVVGVATAKALAFATGKPLYAVNHLHGHIFAAFLDNDAEPPYPFLTLLVSGGHTQLVEVESARELRVIAKTRDDAAGEAFDKTARLLGLPFPGGPALEALARGGNPKAVAFPRYRPEAGALDLSFSGLKTSARYFLASDAAKAVSHGDIAASFQAAIVDARADRSRGARARCARVSRDRAQRRRGREHRAVISVSPYGHATQLTGVCAGAPLLYRQCRDDRCRRGTPWRRRSSRSAHAHSRPGALPFA